MEALKKKTSSASTSPKPKLWHSLKYLFLNELSNYIWITYLILEVLIEMTVALCAEALLAKQVCSSGKALDVYSRCAW
jgi:hypothetical protein